jgi:preprotein translocase subunit SecA
VCGIKSAVAAFGQLEEDADLTQDELNERECYTDPPCGLQILGTERHESRRIDRQLRGRSGRQGDPGSSQFFLSLEDDLMRLFGTERVAKVMDKLGAEEGEVITHPWMTKSIERAQRRVELQNFESRKRLLEYDDVMNQQREVIYDLRLFALEGGEDLKGEAWDAIERSLVTEVQTVLAEAEHAEDWDLPELRNRLLLDYSLVVSILPTEMPKGVELEWTDIDELTDAVIEFAHDAYHQKLETFGEAWEQVLNFIVLSVIDDKWKGHLYDLDHLRDSIRYRAYGQRDPLIEYKREAYEAFVDLINDIRRSIAKLLFQAQLAPRQPLRAQRVSSMSGPSDVIGAGVHAPRVPQPVGAPAGSAPDDLGIAASARVDAPAAVGTPVVGGVPLRAPVAVPADEVGRNDPCPCGSGKKYKKCHGRVG